MGEFERSATHDADTSGESRSFFPADFTDEEVAFARELRAIFPLEREELPPLYVDTLVEDERRAPVPPAFEHAMLYRVFRRLQLPLPRLNGRDGRGEHAGVARRAVEAMRTAGRTTITLLMMGVLGMVATMLLTSPAFAEGVRILLQQTGVHQVAHYPSNVAVVTPADRPAQAPRLDPDAVVYWSGFAMHGYEYRGTAIQPAEAWSDGPIVSVRYARATAGHGQPAQGTQGGSGWLDIRQFSVSPRYAAVLQLVQQGSAREVRVGDWHAVFVDGHWVRSTPRGTYDWEAGTASMLILERDGIVLWISGDQRDGADARTLADVAAHLTSARQRDLDAANVVDHMQVRAPEPVALPSFRDETYALVPHGQSPESGLSLFVQQASAAVSTPLTTP